MLELSKCFKCKHYSKHRRCKAFPDKEIPKNIYFNKKEHEKMIEGQEGNYVFEEMDKKGDKKKDPYLKPDGSFEIIDEFIGVDYMPYKLKKPKKDSERF